MLLEVERRWAVAILEAFAPPSTQSADGVAAAVSQDEARADLAASGAHRRRLAPRTGEVDYVRAITRMMAASTGKARLGIHIGLLLVALAPLWLCGRLATMAGLAMEQRTAILERLARHPFFAVRDLTLLLKLGAAFALMGTASVRARSGYDSSQLTDAARGIEPRRALPVLVADARDPDRISEVA